MFSRFSTRYPCDLPVRPSTCSMIASIRGELALSLRVRSSTWPTVDSTAGRTESLISRRLLGRLLERRRASAAAGARPSRPSDAPRRSCG